MGDDVGNEKPHQQHQEEYDTRDQAKPPDFLSQVFQFVLKWRGLVDFFLNELVEFSLSVVLSGEEAKHESLSTHDFGATDDDWRRCLLVIHPMDDALFEDVLVELMGLSCHRALIHNEVIGPKS